MIGSVEPGDESARVPETRTVLHVGCGSYAPEKLHPIFRAQHWKEVRVDVDARVAPDIVASVTDLSCVASGSVHAVWSSHNIEHLHGFEVPVAFGELRRVLREDGFLVLTTPDLEQVAAEVARGRLEEVLYTSPAGPITALDVLFGHQVSIAAGNGFMAHKTGFSSARLARMLSEAGFQQVLVQRGKLLDLWAVAFRSPGHASPDLAGAEAGELTVVAAG